MRKAFRLALAGLVAFAVWPAQAQSYRRTGPQPRDAYRAYQASPTYSPRSNSPHFTPRGYDGTVYWNTPNTGGNLGGPSAGGSSGGS